METRNVALLIGILYSLFCLQKSYAQHTQYTPAPVTATHIWTSQERSALIRRLMDSRQLLLNELADVSEAQWNFKSAPGKWSIAEVVEHLGLQQDAYYRELSVVTMLPPMPQYRDQVKDLDEKILNYANQEKKDLAPWMLEPMGRWNSKEKAVGQFVRSHGKIIEFILETKADFRSHFTFRKYSDGSLWNIRDLHQLMLTNVAHTERHVNQIRTIKKLGAYPN